MKGAVHGAARFIYNRRGGGRAEVGRPLKAHQLLIANVFSVARAMLPAATPAWGQRVGAGVQDTLDATGRVRVLVALESPPQDALTPGAKRSSVQAMQGDVVAKPGDPVIVDSSDGETLQGAMAKWLQGAAPGDYIAMQAFLPPAEEVLATIAALRANLAATGLPTTLGFGPRFLHSTGQLHKGGRAGVFCLQLIDGGGPELAVPETDHSYRRLIDAQALGDARALGRRGRRVLRMRLGE